MFRHAGSLGGQQGGVGVAGGAIHLREEQAPVSALRGAVEFLVSRMCQQCGRDGLEREIFRSPAEADEGVAFVGAGDFGDDPVGALVQLHGLDARTVEEWLAIEAQLELTGRFGAELEGAAQRRLEVAFPFRHERTSDEEGRGRLTGGDVEGEQALGADVGLSGRGERHLESG